MPLLRGALLAVIPACTRYLTVVFRANPDP